MEKEGCNWKTKEGGGRQMNVGKGRIGRKEEVGKRWDVIGRLRREVRGKGMWEDREKKESWEEGRNRKETEIAGC